MFFKVIGEIAIVNLIRGIAKAARSWYSRYKTIVLKQWSLWAIACKLFLYFLKMQVLFSYAAVGEYDNGKYLQGGGYISKNTGYKIKAS